VARKLATSRNVVCAAPSYLERHGTPKTPADLAAHDCIGYSYAATGDEWHFTDKDGRPESVRGRSVLRTNNGDTMRGAAIAGRGIMRPAKFMVADDLKAGRLVAILTDHHLPDTDLLAIYPSRRHVSAKVRVMVDYLSASFKGTPPWDRT
jgi:DNA-binding transcriptional LysR family regulator